MGIERKEYMVSGTGIADVSRRLLDHVLDEHRTDGSLTVACALVLTAMAILEGEGVLNVVDTIKDMATKLDANEKEGLN